MPCWVSLLTSLCLMWVDPGWRGLDANWNSSPAGSPCALCVSRNARHFFHSKDMIFHGFSFVYFHLQQRLLRPYFYFNRTFQAGFCGLEVQMGWFSAVLCKLPLKVPSCVSRRHPTSILCVTFSPLKPRNILKWRDLPPPRLRKPRLRASLPNKRFCWSWQKEEFLKTKAILSKSVRLFTCRCRVVEFWCLTIISSKKWPRVWNARFQSSVAQGRSRIMCLSLHLKMDNLNS